MYPNNSNPERDVSAVRIDGKIVDNMAELLGQPVSVVEVATWYIRYGSNPRKAIALWKYAEARFGELAVPYGKDMIESFDIWRESNRPGLRPDLVHIWDNRNDSPEDHEAVQAWMMAHIEAYSEAIKQFVEEMMSS